ncbi:MAG: cyclic-di-AMP receptor [Anaerolineales bacterium]|nr:cyclic-di-AMP receptor [Anaerolineales bacterium]
MKLMIVIIRDIDDPHVVQNLVDQGYRVTRMASTGGFLKRGNVTLLIGVEDDRVQTVTELLRQICRPEDSTQHRATVFVVDMPHFEQI